MGFGKRGVPHDVFSCESPLFVDVPKHFQAPEPVLDAKTDDVARRVCDKLLFM